MVSLTGLTLSAPSSARSTPAPLLRLPPLSEVAGPELLSLDLVKYSEWLNVLPFYFNGTDSLPEPVYDIGLDGFDIWQLAQNKSNRGHGIQSVGLQRSSSLPTVTTTLQEPLTRSNSLPDAVSPPLFPENQLGRKLSVDEQLSRATTPKPLFSTHKALQGPAKQHLKLPSVAEALQGGGRPSKAYGIPPNPFPLPPLRVEQPSTKSQQPVFGIAKHLPSADSMVALYDDVVYQPLGPVYRPASRSNEQTKPAKPQPSSQPGSSSFLRTAQEHVQYAKTGSQAQPSQFLLSSPRKKSSAVLPVPAKVPSRVTAYDTEAARSERHRSKSTSPAISKNAQRQQQNLVHASSRESPAARKVNENSSSMSIRLAPLDLNQNSGFVVGITTLPEAAAAQPQPGYEMGQTIPRIPYTVQHPQLCPLITIESLYSIPGSILLGTDYRFVYLGKDCATWLHLSSQQIQALPKYSMPVLCVQSDVKALRNFLKLARTEIGYHNRVKAAAYAAGRPINPATDGRTMSQTFNLTRGDGHVEPFVLTISLSLRILPDRPSPVFSGTLIPLWMSMTGAR